MKQPDRFAQMVLQASKNKHGKHLLFLGLDQVAALLRRQHAAVVRLVKSRKCDVYGRIDGGDLLRALARWKRGTK